MAELTSFLRTLLRRAREAGGPVHGIVLPEGALDEETARGVAQALAGEAGLELFIAGVTSEPVQASAAPRNLAYACLNFKRNKLEWWQSKHHRRLVDPGQVARYRLDRVLAAPGVRWWEDIDISNREVDFYVFRPGASIAVLVCEDLARVDPVQPVVRAVGPTLVVSLLLDGAQVERRWPGKYATVLADDPGSAVLTLTSLGMVRRSLAPGESLAMPVALWKDSAGRASELALPRGDPPLASLLGSTGVRPLTIFPRRSRPMAAATYDQRPRFLVRELDKILGENDRGNRAARVEAKLPTVSVSPTGSVVVVPPATRPRRRQRG